SPRASAARAYTSAAANATSREYSRIASRRSSPRPATRSSVTSTVTRISCSVCCRLTLRSSSRGAAAKMSAAIHGVDVGSSYHWMKEVIPACATSPTADRRAGGMSAYHGRVSSSRLMVTVAMSPEIRRSQASVAALSMVEGEDAVTDSALTAGVAARAGVDVVQRVLADGVGDCGALDPALVGERLQGADHHRRPVDLEEATSGGAGVREAEAVRAERVVRARDPGADLVLHRVHVVAHGDDRTLGALQLLSEVGRARLLLGVQEVVLVDCEPVMTQLAPRGHRPDVGVHAPVVPQQLLGLESPRHADAGGEQLGLGALAGADRDAVQAADDALDVHILRLGRLNERLVVHG